MGAKFLPFVSASCKLKVVEEFLKEEALF